VITAAASGVKDAKTITVVKNVTKLRVPLSAVNITVKKKLSLAPVVDDGAVVISGAVLSYKSSAPKVAKVDAKGNVSALKAGKVSITITAANGKKLVVKVTVAKKAVKLSKFTLKGLPAKSSLKVGKSAQLVIKLGNTKASDLKVSYKSSAPKVIKVDKAGKITALKKGSAKITVKVGSKKVTTKAIVVK
jgi:uncharacterized protein YjdB